MDIPNINLKDLNLEKIKGFYKDPQTRNYAVGGTLVFVGIFVLCFMIIPQFLSMANVTREVGDLSNKIEINEKRISKVDELRKKTEELRVELQKRAKHLPAEKEIPELLEGFASIAKKSDVNLLSITPHGLQAAGGGDILGKYYREMPLTITAKSGYHELGHFTSNLENEKRVIIIDDLQIRGNSGTPRQHDVVMKVKTYVSMEKK